MHECGTRGLVGGVVIKQRLRHELGGRAGASGGQHPPTFAALLDKVAAGSPTVPIARTYPLDQATQALQA